MARLLVIIGLVRSHHQKGQLPRRLQSPFLLLIHFLGARHVRPPLLLLRLRALYVVDLVSRVLGSLLFLTPLLYDPTIPSITVPCYVKSCLGFCHHFSVLVLLQTDMLVLQLLAYLSFVH